MTVTDGAAALTSTAFTNHNKCSLLGGLRVQSCELCLLIDTSGSASPSAFLPLRSPKPGCAAPAEPAACELSFSFFFPFLKTFSYIP